MRLLWNTDCRVEIQTGYSLHSIPITFIDVARQYSLFRKLVGTFWPVLVTGTRAFTPRLSLDAHDPVLVLGNQKTGSTAIARLLAHWGQLHATTDIHPLQTGSVTVRNEPASIAHLIQHLRYYFRRDLIKENELTPATDALLEVLPQARPVYVVRHPAHNIRSILDRLDLPGTPRPLHTLDLSEGGWRAIVENHHFDGQADDYITSLAQRWSQTTAIYRRHRDRLTLVRYEDFMADKHECIRRLADRLGISKQRDIRPLLDVPFQPRGRHRSVPPESFFSPQALTIINEECAAGMRALDYEPIVPASDS